MVSSEGVTIVPIADAAWPDVQQVFGTRGDPARCWCQFFKLSNQQWWDGSTEAKEALLHEQAAEAPAPVSSRIWTVSPLAGARSSRGAIIRNCCGPRSSPSGALSRADDSSCGRSPALSCGSASDAVRRHGPSWPRWIGRASTPPSDREFPVDTADEEDERGGAVSRLGFAVRIRRFHRCRAADSGPCADATGVLSTTLRRIRRRQTDEVGECVDGT